MTRQQRRYLDRELSKCAKGMAHIAMKKNIDIVDHNHREFLRHKAERLRRSRNESSTKAS